MGSIGDVSGRVNGKWLTKFSEGQSFLLYYSESIIFGQNTVVSQSYFDKLLQGVNHLWTKYCSESIIFGQNTAVSQSSLKKLLQ